MIPRARGKGCGSGLDAAIVREYLELGECVRVVRCAGVDSCNGSLGVCERAAAVLGVRACGLASARALCGASGNCVWPCLCR